MQHQAFLIITTVFIIEILLLSNCHLKEYTEILNFSNIYNSKLN